MTAENVLAAALKLGASELSAIPESGHAFASIVHTSHAALSC
jgi:hypothetical protein